MKADIVELKIIAFRKGDKTTKLDCDFMFGQMNDCGTLPWVTPGELPASVYIG